MRIPVRNFFDLDALNKSHKSVVIPFPSSHKVSSESGGHAISNFPKVNPIKVDHVMSSEQIVDTKLKQSNEKSDEESTIKKLTSEIDILNNKVLELTAQLETVNNEKDVAIKDAVFEKECEINALHDRLIHDNQEYAKAIKERDAQIADYKKAVSNLEAQLSMIKSETMDVNASDFRIGRKVDHISRGEGIITDIKVDDNNALFITILFNENKQTSTFIPLAFQKGTLRFVDDTIVSNGEINDVPQINKPTKKRRGRNRRYNANLRNYYIGQTKKQVCGKLATVIDYRGCNDINVQFTDGSILEHVSLDAWRHHRLKQPS